VRPQSDDSVAGSPGDNPTDSPRFRSLDAWRGIAALFVAALHLKTFGWINQSLVVQGAGHFVDFFFVLSGFVIAHAYRERLERGWIMPFIVRRVGRLWPLNAATLAALVLMAAAGSLAGLRISGFTLVAIPANLTMTQSWGYLDYFSWNHPAWSISTEMFAYLAFALLAWGFRGRGLDMVCAAVLVASVAFNTLIETAVDGLKSFRLLAGCLYGFMIGVLAQRFWLLTSFRPKGEIPALLATLVATALVPPQAEFLIPPLFAWVVLVYASDKGPVSHLLHRPFPQMLGRVSYSIYMNHYLVALAMLTGLFLFTGMTAEVDGVTTIVDRRIADLVTLLYLATVIGLSCLTYAWIEKPGRGWFNQKAEPVPAAW